MANEPEFNPTKTQCCTAQIHAQNLSESLLLAYWMAGRNEQARDHHVKVAGEQLQAICAELGFAVTPLASQSSEKEAA